MTLVDLTLFPNFIRFDFENIFLVEIIYYKMENEKEIRSIPSKESGLRSMPSKESELRKIINSNKSSPFIMKIKGIG